MHRRGRVDGTNHLRELAILHHHGVDDAYESFVRRKECRSSRKRISLEHALTRVFGENFDNPASLSAGSYIPLKVSSGDVEYRI